jgi:hypothetical protein
MKQLLFLLLWGIPLCAALAGESPRMGTTPAPTSQRAYSEAECQQLGLRAFDFAGRTFSPTLAADNVLVYEQAGAFVPQVADPTWIAKIRGLLSINSKQPANTAAPVSSGGSTTTPNPNVNVVNASGEKFPYWTSRKIGDTWFHTVIEEVVFTPSESYLSLGILVERTDSTMFFFGNRHVKVTGNGGLQINRIELLETAEVRSINKRLSKLKMFVVAEEKTYVEVDCDGNFNMGLTGRFEFASDTFVRIGDDGQVPTDPNLQRLTATFSIMNVRDLSGLMLGFSLSRFSLKSSQKVIFEPGELYFDWSDADNPPAMRFPKEYTPQETSTLWKGLYLSSFTVYFPYKAKTSTTTSSAPTAPPALKDRIWAGVRDLLVDREGVSMKMLVGLANAAEFGGGGGFSVSVDTLFFDLVKNVPRRLGMIGRVDLPFIGKTANVTPSTNPSPSEGNAQKDLRVMLQIDPMNPEVFVGNITLLKEIRFGSDLIGSAAFLPGTSITVGHGNVQKAAGDWYFEGKFNFSAQLLKKGSSGGTVQPNTQASTGWGPFGFTVTNLRLQSYGSILVIPPANAPPSEAFSISFITPPGSPLQIKNITIRQPLAAVYSSSGGTAVEFFTTMGLNLGGGSSGNSPFAADATFSIIGEMGSDGKFAYKKFVAYAINIKVETAAFYLEGGITRYDNHPLYGDGYKGMVAFELLRQSGGSSSGGFKFNIDFRLGETSGPRGRFFYFFLDGQANFTPAIQFPGIPGLAINGFMGGVSWATKSLSEQAFLSRYNNNTALLADAKTKAGSYVAPDQNMGLGLKIGMTFTNSGAAGGGTQLFEGMMALEFAFNSNWGPAYFKGYGSLTLMMPTGVPPATMSQLGTTLKALETAESVTSLVGGGAVTNSDLKNAMTSMLVAAPSIKGTYFLEYDFQTKNFNLTLEAFVMLPGVQGNMDAAGKAGSLSLFIGPSGWFIKLGTPTRPIGLRLVGIANIQGYFMTGTTTLAQEYMALLNFNGSSGNPYRPNPFFPSFDDNAIRTLANGSIGFGIRAHLGFGFDFGFSVSLGSLGSIGGSVYGSLIFDASLSALIGKNNGGPCPANGGINPYGMNGWYGFAGFHGNLYAMLGARGCLGKICGSVDIANFGVNLVANAQGPNPLYLNGSFWVGFKIIGYDIGFSAPFSYGTRCF